MRVAYLINQYPKVSHTFIRREIQSLERAGVEVTRIALRGWDAAITDPADEAEREVTRYVLLGGIGRSAKSLWRSAVRNPRAVLRGLGLAWAMRRGSDKSTPYHLAYLAEASLVLDWLREQRVQHVHAHFGTNPTEVAMLIHALGGPHYSFTVHGPEEFDRPIGIGLPEKLRRAAFAVAISSFGRSQLCRWVEPEHWRRIEVVHCGLEAAFHANALTEPGDGALVSPPPAQRLVCVGRLCEQKAQLLLIEAARRVCDTGQQFELVLAGDGELRPALEERIRTLGLAGVVRITGWISSAQVRVEILAARALVLPSFAEGLPVVLMEAMALLRPVISTYVAGIPELVRDGECGWLVPAGDVDALAAAMLACLAAPADQLRRQGEAARARALARHDIDTETAKLVALFATAIAANSDVTAKPGSATIEAPA